MHIGEVSGCIEGDAQRCSTVSNYSELIDTIRDKKMAEEIVGAADNVLKSFDCAIFGDINRDAIKKAMDGVQAILKEAKRRSYY